MISKPYGLLPYCVWYQRQSFKVGKLPRKSVLPSGYAGGPTIFFSAPIERRGNREKFLPPRLFRSLVQVGGSSSIQREGSTQGRPSHSVTIDTKGRSHQWRYKHSHIRDKTPLPTTFCSSNAGRHIPGLPRVREVAVPGSIAQQETKKRRIVHGFAGCSSVIHVGGG